MQILKRLALSIPTLMLISSTAFFLSKTMPGSSGNFLIADDLSIATRAQTALKESIYKEYLQRTGQDKPLFYFSMTSLAEPDTLYKIFPESHQKFLKKLCFAYGNWPFIAHYYQTLLRFGDIVKSCKTQKGKVTILAQALNLFSTTSEAQIKKILNNLELEMVNTSFGKEVDISLLKVQNAFQLLQKNQATYRKFIPVLHWNGLKNQYHIWLSGLLKGEMGYSLRDNRPVADIIGEALGITLVMTIGSLFFGWAIALFLGIIINLSNFQKGGKIILNSLYLLDTLPLFLLSFLLLILFSGEDFLGLLPSFGLGNYTLTNNAVLGFFVLLTHLFLPILCMTLVIVPYLTGQVDRALKEVEKQEYIKTARAKGLSNYNILRKHMLSNAWTPLITIFTDRLPAIISGALVVEVIFAIPGMGRLLASSVNARDYPVILGIIILLATVKIGANILADISYSWADPRIKFKFKA